MMAASNRLLPPWLLPLEEMQSADHDDDAPVMYQEAEESDGYAVAMIYAASGRGVHDLK